jgi:hypothetical protein
MWRRQLQLFDGGANLISFDGAALIWFVWNS